MIQLKHTVVDGRDCRRVSLSTDAMLSHVCSQILRRVVNLLQPPTD